MRFALRKISLFLFFLLNTLFSQTVLNSNLKILDPDLHLKIIKQAQGGFPLSFEKYKVLVCYKNKPSNFLLYSKSNNCYYKLEELTPYEIYLKAQKNIVVPEERALINVFSGINFTGGSYYYKIIDETQKNIDLDYELEILTKRIPFLKHNLTDYARNITIAIIDTGIDLSHIWFKNRSIEAYGVQLNSSNNQCELTSNYDQDNIYSGHGTFVSSEVVSLTNNKTKIVLLSPFSLKVSNIACAIKLAVERFKADIITMSLGAIFYFFDGYNNIVYDAIDYVMNLTNNKTLIFIAAGNSGNTKYHKRLVSGTINLKNLQNFLSNVPDPIEIVFKNYVRGKYNISFFSGTVLLAEINWNETKNNYDLKVYSSQIDFDPKNYGFPNIVQLESGKSNETNLIIYFNTTLDNITITLTPLNTSFTTDFYFMAYKYYKNFDVLEEGDGYGTINLLAVHPAVFTIGSLTTIDKVYFFENSSKDYMYYFYNNGIIGNMSLFSSKSLNDVDNFTFKKIDLIAPGTLFGANYLKDYYAIYKKTNNYGVTPEFTLFSNSFNWISYITFKKGTSMATPFAASIFASMKSIIKNGDVWLFKRLLPYISFDTQYTQGLSEIEKGKGIININKAFNILPQISLEFYSIDYLNKTLNLTVNVFNNLNVPYNLTFLQIEFKDNNGKKYFNFTNLAYGINNLILNLSQLNISYNGSTYNLTFKGDILEYKTYQITINGTKINIKNATLYLDLIYNGSFFVNNSILQLDLNYSYNYLGTVFCDLFINNNKTNSFNISKFGLNSINFSIKDFLSLNPTNIKIYCDKNSEIINYNLEIKDFILETKVDIIEEPVEIINLTIINLANLTNLENNSIVLPIYLNITIKNLNLTKNYLLKHKENISETLNLTYNKNFDFTAKSFDLPLKNKNKVFDLLAINVLSKINFTDFEILSLNIKNNTYYLDFVLNLDRLTRIDNKECIFYFYKNRNLIKNKELYDEFFIKETFLSNETKKIRLKTFKNFYNINLDTEINISIVFNCSNNFIKIQSINKTVFYNSSDIFFYDYNISLKRKSFFEDLNISFNLTNPSSYLIVIFEKFNKSFYSKEYNSTTSFFNISLLLSWIEFNKRLLDLIKEKIGSEPFIYSYNLNKSLTNNPNKFIFDKYYNFSIVSKVYYPFNKNATYISIEKEIKYKQERPKLFLLSNRSPDTYNLTWFGNLSWWFLELINNESKELNLSTYLKLELESKNITSKKTILIKNKTKLLLFNYSKIKEDILKDLKEGEFNLSAYFYLNYSNLSLPLIKFEDKLYFDLIYPQIINFTIYKAIKIYNKINNASKAFYNLEEYNKLNNTYYTNDNAFVKIHLYEKNFDNYFSVDLAINNDTAVIYSINQTSNSSIYSISFVINKSVLNYGKNNIKIILKDTFGNFVNKSFELIYDNISPQIIFDPDSANYYNMIALFITNNDDYPYKIIVKNNANNVSKEFIYLNKKDLFVILPCVSLANTINVTVFDRALNNNSFTRDYTCYLDFNKFNVSSNVQIFYLGILNKSSYYLRINKTSTNSYIKDNYLYLNNTYKLIVDGEIDFLILGIEEKLNESFEVYNLVSPDLEILNRLDKENFVLYKNTSLIVSSFFFENLRDDIYYFYSIHRKKIFDFELLTDPNLIYYKAIPIKLKIFGNLSKITINNLNNSASFEYKDDLLLPCINGKNIIKIRGEAYNSFLEKNYTFYCNNSLVLADNSFVEFAVLKNSSNLIINDSYASDIINNTHLIKKLLINFTNNNVVLKLKIPWNNEYTVNKIILQKENKNLTINNYYFEGDYLYILLNLSQDPILLIEGIKETENFEEDEQNSQNNQEQDNYNDDQRNNYASSGSSGSGGSYSDFYYEDSDKEESLKENYKDYEEIIINENLIFLRIRVNESPKTIMFDNEFIEKLIVYARIKDLILVNISIEERNDSIMNKKVKYMLKANSIKNASLIIKLNKSFDYLIGKGENLRPLNKYFISLREKDSLLVLSKEIEAHILNKTENKKNYEKKEENQKKETQKIEDSKEKYQEESPKEKKERSSLIKKILIFLGFGIVIFLIIDFIDFLIKKKKGLI